MRWNWQLPDWPKFSYDPLTISEKEKRFLLQIGSASAFLQSIESHEYHRFVVEILSSEGLESSKIEGEILDRESLQSSIKQHFGLYPRKKEDNKESRMAKLLCDVYEAFAQPLSHETLWRWHSELFKEQAHIVDCGKYRTQAEPMQIVSNRYDSTRVFYEAPPSKKVHGEMSDFIEWFNTSSTLPILVRASIAHVYFESIHPFEDGNGRIGRILVEKVLSQGIQRPILIAVSKILERRRKEYYAALERCNHTLEVNHWLEFFAEVILQAQAETMLLLSFLIEKAKMLLSLVGKINARQEKVLLRMFAEGPSGFKGGLSAENYIAIAKTSRATATRDLQELVHLGVLIKTGELRHTRYQLNIRPLA